jgi:ubiquinone/menaquinone biosynthesis C-methylase UbiE
MVDNKELFAGKSEDYCKFRPSYPDAALEWLKTKTDGEDVLDVGAGTGIFTAKLLNCFRNVSAVEPNADMRRVFKKFFPDIYCSGGSGEDTKFSDKSFDLITVAQAFHWLDAEKFKAEATRILRRDGKVAIIWNTSLKSDFTDERNRVCQQYCPRFRSGHAGQLSVAEGDAFLRNVYFREVEFVSFSNPFVMDFCAFEGNMRSRSYSLLPQDSEYECFMAELKGVFESYSVNNVVIEPQETQIYLGSF